MDPSCTIGFYCSSKEEFETFCQQAAEVSLQSMHKWELEPSTPAEDRCGNMSPISKRHSCCIIASVITMEKIDMDTTYTSRVSDFRVRKRPPKCSRAQSTVVEKTIEDVTFVPGLKPWPNGTANSGQVFNLMELGIVSPPTWLELAGVGSSWLEWWSSSNCRHVFHRLATSANSRQVVLLLLGDFAVVVGKLNGFLASWLSTWRGYRRCKFWFSNLARVGLSWEYRFSRA